MRRVMLYLIAVVLMLSMTAGAAFAGEVTGNLDTLEIENSKWGTGLHARSECAYSGLDEPDGVDEDADDVLFGRTQSWGQLPKDVRAFLKANEGSPGFACSPGR